MSKRKAPERESSAKKKKTEESKFGLEWNTINDTLVIFSSNDLKGSEKVLAFDMDDTLITTKSGGKFPSGRKDWVWWDESVPSTLKQKHSEGYKIVIFTNQAGVEKKKTKLSDITGKILDLSNELDIPLQAFVAIATDIHRKPNNTMWEIFCKDYNQNVKIKEATYIGDAAGRKAGWKPGLKKDFSCGDRKFALNSGIQFKTPDEFFLGENPIHDFDWDGPDPQELYKKIKDNKLPIHKLTSDSQELIIMVGKPASGKSTFTEKHFVTNNYVRVNRDTLKTMPKCIKAVREALKNGKSCVVDNTNPSIDSRKPFIDIAKELKIPVRCFILEIDSELNEHLNIFRERTLNIRRIPDIAYNKFKKDYKEPSKSEGISEIIKIPFVLELEEDKKKFFFHRA